MASMRLKAGKWIVCFRVPGSGQQFNRDLGTGVEKDAAAKVKRIESTLHDIKTGRLAVPEDCCDLGTFVMSDGKLAAKLTPQVVESIKTVWERYQAELPTTAKEASTRNTERVHFGHLLRILGEDTGYSRLGTADLQKYIRRRSEDQGRRGPITADTIEKEIQTFASVWNSFGVPQKIVSKSFRDT